MLRILSCCHCLPYVRNASLMNIVCKSILLSHFLLLQQVDAGGLSKRACFLALNQRGANKVEPSPIFVFKVHSSRRSLEPHREGRTARLHKLLNLFDNRFSVFGLKAYALRAYRQVSALAPGGLSARAPGAGLGARHGGLRPLFLRRSSPSEDSSPDVSGSGAGSGRTAPGGKFSINLSYSSLVTVISISR